jgi:hypothetical protein
MIYPGMYEDLMKEHEFNNDYENAVKDTVAVLEQEGYKAGALILQRMLPKRDNSVADSGSNKKGE